MSPDSQRAADSGPAADASANASDPSLPPEVTVPLMMLASSALACVERVSRAAGSMAASFERIAAAQERQADALEALADDQGPLGRQADALDGIRAALDSDADDGGTLDAVAVSLGNVANAQARIATVQEHQAKAIEEFFPAARKVLADLERSSGDGESWKEGPL